MKKRLLTLSMVGLLSLGIASCSTPGQKTEDGKQIIVSFKDKDGNAINYTADELLDQYGSTETGVKAYYNAIYDILIRKSVNLDENDPLKMDVNKEIDDFVNTCKTTAATNGTTYKDELSKALEQEGVKDLGELRSLKELQIQKREYEKKFYDDDKMKKFTHNFIEEKAPYHIRHILVKTDDVEGSSVYNKEISSAESKKINSIVTRLASGEETFGQIAYDASDDTSNALYGSVGLMQTDTAFVSEFKYSIYYYDAFLSGKNDTGKTQEEILDMLQVPSEISLGGNFAGEEIKLNTKQVLDSKVGIIDYAEIDKFDTYSETEKTYKNLTYTDEVDKLDGHLDTPRHEITSHYYPRNVLFNENFNNHGLSFIISNDPQVNSGKNWATPSAELKAVIENNINGDFNGKILIDAGDESTTKDDEPILVTYNPTTGLHFMMIEKSPIRRQFEGYTKYVNSSDKVEEEVTFNSLDEELEHYFDLTVPSGTATVTNDNRYITYIKSNRTTYDNRATELKNAIKSFDPNMGYRIFEDLLYAKNDDGSFKVDEKGNYIVRSDVTINPTVLSNVQDYIADQRANTSYTNNSSVETSWTGYLQLLEIQEDQKASKQLSFEETQKYFEDTRSEENGN